MMEKMIIGLNIEAPGIKIGRITGSKIDKIKNIEIDLKGEKSEILQEIIRLIESNFNSSILGIGIGVPTTVDVEKGIAYDVSRIASWKEVHIKKELESHFKVPVYVNNDANCFTVGEYYYGKGRKYENFVGLIIGEGMGGGVIVNKNLLSGSSGGVGEFGYLPYKDRDYDHYCSKRYFEHESGMSFEKILKLAEQNDKKSLQLFNAFGQNLGHALEMIITVLDPQCVVLGGEVSTAYDLFKDSMWQVLHSCSLPHVRNILDVRVSDVQNIDILGAAALYLDAESISSIKEEKKKRRKSEIKLREIQEKYFYLFNQITDPIFIFDKKTLKFLECNTAVEVLYGYTKEEILSMTLNDLYPPEEVASLMKSLNITNHSHLAQFTHIKKNRRKITVEVLYDSIYYEGIDASLHIVRDITDRLKKERELQRKTKQTSLLYEVSKRISSVLHLDIVLSEIVNSINDIYDYYGVMLLLLDEKNQHLNLQSIAGGYANIFPKNLSINLGEGMIGQAALTKNTQISGDVTINPHFVKKAEEDTISELSVPIIGGDKVIGVLDFQSMEANAYDDSDVTTAETLSTQIAAAIENARLYNQAQEEIRERLKVEKELRRSRDSLRGMKRETDTIFLNVEEGLFLLDSKHRIGSQYSTAFTDIMQTSDLAKRNLLDIFGNQLSPKMTEDINDYLDLMFNPAIDKDTLDDLNPLTSIHLTFRNRGELLSKDKVLSFKFKRILLNKKIIGLIATVTDITEQVILAKKLEESEEQSKQQMEWFLSILHVEPQLLKEFIEGAHTELNSIEESFKSGGAEEDFNAILEKIYRSVHMVKGNASLLDLKFFAKKAHDFEEKIEEIKKKDRLVSTDFIPLVMNLRELRTNIDEINNMIERISQIHEQFRPRRSFESKMLVKSINNLIQTLSHDLKKEVRLIHKDFEGEIIPYQYRLLVKDILIQLVRNSMTHGIEVPKEREKNHKSRRGSIEISTAIYDSKFSFKYKDDGRGLHLDKLKEKAIASQKWTVSEIEKWDEKGIAGTIFESGISTSETTDLVAGRGVGMDIIKHKVESHNGEIMLDYQKGKFIEFIVVLPNDKH
jgi:PAS domain S-box-containing protein